MPGQRGVRANLVVMDEATDALQAAAADADAWTNAFQKFREAMDAPLPPPPFDNLLPPPLCVRESRFVVGQKVYVAWGESRGYRGTITSGGRTPGTNTAPMSYYVSIQPMSPSDKSQRSGLYVYDSLRLILEEPPAFSSEVEAEAWLEAVNDQQYFPNERVRVSKDRIRDLEIKHGTVVRYLGIRDTTPPQYIVAFVDADGELDEVKIVTEYFIHGRVED